MALLQKRKVKAYFVIQPFNPKLILDMERFDPVVAAITGMCTRYQMGCLDLYSIPFEPGMVRDDMHLAELAGPWPTRALRSIFPDEAIFAGHSPSRTTRRRLTGMPAGLGPAVPVAPVPVPWRDPGVRAAGPAHHG